MLASFSDLFAWYQIPLLLILLFCIPTCVFGVGALLFVGGRYIAKSSRATYWWSVLTYVVSVIGGMISHIVCIVIGAVISSMVESPAPGILLGLIGLIVGLLVTWLIIKSMFEVSFGKAILAWLPAFGVQFVIMAPLLVSILLPSVNRARELAKQAVCKTRLKGIGIALELYNQSENGYPSSWVNLVENGYASEKNFQCPSDPNLENGSYFYLPPQESDSGEMFVMCDLQGNHHGEIRNVLRKKGMVEGLSEEVFQMELTQPYNARFAEALKKAEGP